MRYLRIYNDEQGESHFEDLDLELAPVQYAPPAPEFDVSAPMPASTALLMELPPGWFGGWHPTPHRQLYFALTGRLEIAVSDGEVRVLEPGAMVLVEDELGSGHTTRALGDEPASGAFIHLAPEV
jgi:quercetin dioxygenase-like cupin family protein